MNLTARKAAHAALFIVVLLALASYRAGRWVGANRQQILDAIARAVLATYGAGQALGRWWRANRQHVTEAAATAAEIAADLVDRLRWEAWLHEQATTTLLPVQPVSEVAPITANLEAAWMALRYWVLTLLKLITKSLQTV